MEKVLNQRKVLFLCTGNSCLSQVVQTIINARLNEDWQAFSTGTEPAGYVNLKAIPALTKIGIRHAVRAKHLDKCRQTTFGKIVTAYDAVAEKCPLWLGAASRVYLRFPDPAKAIGTEDEIMRAFRYMRDDIANQIPLAQIPLALNNLKLLALIDHHNADNNQSSANSQTPVQLFP